MNGEGGGESVHGLRTLGGPSPGEDHGCRTQADFAHLLRDVADEQYPTAEKIVLVMDNLNTHKLSVLYAVFPPDEARRLWERFEVHHTPKHASWLNMAECELSVLGRQCLDQRIDSPARLGERNSARGNNPATKNLSASTGNSPPTTPGSSSNDFTPCYRP